MTTAQDDGKVPSLRAVCYFATVQLHHILMKSIMKHGQRQFRKGRYCCIHFRCIF